MSTILLALGCTGKVETPPPPPPPPPPAVVDVDPTTIVTGPPVGTDAEGFISKELADGLEPTALTDELSGEAIGVTYTIPADRAVRGVPCAASAPVVVNVDGSWECTASKAWTVGEVTWTAGATVTAWIGSAHVRFVPIEDGKSLTLAGLPCSVFAELDADGHLVATQIAGSHTFQGGVKLPGGTLVMLDGHGKITQAHLFETATVQGQTHPADWGLKFDDIGRLTKAWEEVGD